MATTALIIDDDQELTQLLHDYLAKFDIKAHAAHSPSQGFRLFKRHKPDVVILDIMLPEMDGFEVCKALRKESSTPIIMLTARGEISDRVVGLEIGADDYLPKPFDPRELVARIQTILRRLKGKKSQKHALASGTLVLDPSTRRVTLGKKALDLSTTEYEILSLLMAQAGECVHRDQLIAQVQGEAVEAFNRSIDLAVSRLRHKLGDDGKKQRFIKTIWGSGYQFIGKVEPHAL
jgi:DNA-binding response OmpR family regulator